MRKLPMSMVMAGLLFVGTACEYDESGSTAESVAESASGNSAPVAFTGDVAECLQGTWVQNAGHLQEFLSAVGGPLVFVVMPDSLLTMVLAGDAVSSAADAIAHKAGLLASRKEADAKQSLKKALRLANIIYPGHDRPFRNDTSMQYLEDYAIRIRFFTDPSRPDEDIRVGSFAPKSFASLP